MSGWIRALGKQGTRLQGHGEAPFDDARALAGIGNWVADEALYQSEHRWGGTRGAERIAGQAIVREEVGGRTTAWVPTRQK